MHPSDVLNLPRPAWMSEDLVLLEEQARRFIADEFAPHLDQWHEEGMYDARGLDQGRAGRPALRLDAGGIRRRRRHLRA